MYIFGNIISPWYNKKSNHRKLVCPYTDFLNEVIKAPAEITFQENSCRLILLVGRPSVELDMVFSYPGILT